MEKRIQRIVCISVVLLCVCTLVEVISSIYKLPLTEWDKKNIETARAEVQEILNADPDSFPEATYAFDNETAVADAEKVDVGKVYDSFPGLYSSVIGKEVNDETLKEAGLDCVLDGAGAVVVSQLPAAGAMFFLPKLRMKRISILRVS